ncbi:penicillin-binding protein 1B [Enterovibrio norvegicus FF-33]|uniref:penicillin-binding protein 1B n=1 Tax=Enterovibrio norvegicus TaxID=188144 RepID=UPI00030A4716|nr:penicillin-binding protein 1B [Enterovibrio norvegicus]OEE70507.1 penicillin-binding protein 1B [Enterovibrio norvegicus FF-33]
MTKQTPKKTTSRTRKSSTPAAKKKKTPPSKGWGKKLLSLGFKLGLVGIAALAILGIYLDGKIRDRFDGQIWQLPAVVYGRILHLAPGDSVDITTLKRELDLLNYNKVRSPTRAGEYSASKNRVEIIRRPFEFEDGPESAQHVMLTFDAQGVTSIKQLDSGKQRGYLRIEPKLLGMMESNTDEQRIFMPRERFPEFLVDALLTTEDRDFYHHDGVSPLAIARAMVVNLKAGRTVQGGSTLTQQLAKNLFLTRDRTLWRKVQEAYIAIILDYRYSKDRILEAYLNEVYLGQARGQSVHGFPLGARLYFGRPIEELRIDQLAMLVGTVKGPSYYNPWRHPERAQERRDLILRMMMENGVLTANQYAQAAARKLDVQKSPSLNSRQPAYFEQLTREIRERVGSDFNPESGLRVFSTLDPLSQSLIEKTVVNKVKALKKVAGEELEAAVVIADRQSGEIRAMVGGSRPGYAGFNRALNGSRQIGSLSKPAVYLAALSQPDKYNLATPLDDKPLVLKGDQGSEWRPRNYDRKYRGQVPLLQALAHSYNIPTVNLGLALGLDKVVSTFDDLGVNPDQITRVPSLLLGAFTLTPMEVTQMFQTLGSGGRKAELTALRAVVTLEGQVLYRNWPKSSQTLPEQASWLTMYAMKHVVKEGTARYLNTSLAWASLAGKTGTTDKNRDSWYVGIDGREVVTVWLGRDDNKPTKLTGSSGALRVYTDYITARQPKKLILNWPSEVTSVPYQVQEGQYVTNCFSKQKLPMWDPKGYWRKRCDKPDPVGWFNSLFD